MVPVHLKDSRFGVEVIGALLKVFQKVHLREMEKIVSALRHLLTDFASNYFVLRE